MFNIRKRSKNKIKKISNIIKKEVNTRWIKEAIKFENYKCAPIKSCNDCKYNKMCEYIHSRKTIIKYDTLKIRAIEKLANIIKDYYNESTTNNKG